ncbi:MAG TPA: polysaccharide deacetylase family protein [Gaiellaceae bacterium]
MRRALLAAAALALVLPGSARTNVPLRDDAVRSSLPTLAARGLAVYCGGERGRYVALTFDDGPGRYTARVLSLLARADARATFFVVGNRVAYWPALVREELERHAVGNHTWDHSRLPGLDERATYAELARTQAAVVRATGMRPLLFRPPYERVTESSTRVARALGLAVVLWSVDSGDSLPGATADSVARTVIASLRPGAIVVLHDIHPAGVAALPRILRAIRRLGLRAVTVPELVALDPPSHAQLFAVRPSGRCS